MEGKRKESALVPYRFECVQLFIYLQKRSKSAKRYPGFFGFWGGGLEGEESPEEGMLREIKEELDFVPSEYVFFGRYEFEHNEKYFYVTKVTPDFEKGIKILEGDFGKWFSLKDCENEEKINEQDRKILGDIFKRLNSA